MTFDKLKNWAFKTFFPEEYKTVDDLRKQEIYKNRVVNRTVEFLNQEKEKMGEETFNKLWGGDDHLSNYFVGVIPHNWEERIDAKIAELNGEEPQEN